MNDSLRGLACCLLLMAVPCEAAQKSAHVLLFPKLRPGQIITYQIGYRAETRTNTESTVTAPMAPTGGKTDAHLLLQVEVEDVLVEAGKPAARLRTWLTAPDAIGPNESAKSGSHDNAVEFTLHHDGQVTDLNGLDRLSSEEQTVWQQWVARFGGGAAVPEKGVRPGDKWRTDEPISTALLSGLSWEKESEYVNDAPCGSNTMTPPNSPPAAALPAQDTCAVILTTATIKQKSNQKDATPEDYKLHDLRNMGVAKGKNEIITYISLKTGLVVRATEDASQSLNVIVAKSNASNRVHYMIDAESHAQILLVSADPSTHP